MRSTFRLSDVTTLRLGGPARRVVDAGSEDELISAVRDADAAGEPVLVVGGGSNLVVGDDGFDGTVVLVRTRGVAVDTAGCDGPGDAGPAAVCGGVVVTVAAGENWDDFVARAVASGWIGIEALSGIPGSVGATPVQNVGAYGQEVADTIWAVRVWDRVDARVRTVPLVSCGFGYRTSVFKQTPDRYVVLTVSLQFTTGDLGAPVKYAELARRLGVEVGDRVRSARVRDAVLELRRGKGMVLDPLDHDTWSAGSFFTNPLLAPDQAAALPDAAPRFPQPDGTVKTSAAWLIDHAGFAKGYPGDRAGATVSLSTKHALALTNRGSATTSDLLDLAREVQRGVERAFAVRLMPEPVIVGTTW